VSKNLKRDSIADNFLKALKTELAQVELNQRRKSNKKQQWVLVTTHKHLYDFVYLCLLETKLENNQSIFLCEESTELNFQFSTSLSLDALCAPNIKVQESLDSDHKGEICKLSDFISRRSHIEHQPVLHNSLKDLRVDILIAVVGPEKLKSMLELITELPGYSKLLRIEKGGIHYTVGMCGCYRVCIFECDMRHISKAYQLWQPKLIIFLSITTVPAQKADIKFAAGSATVNELIDHFKPFQNFLHSVTEPTYVSQNFQRELKRVSQEWISIEGLVKVNSFNTTIVEKICSVLIWYALENPTAFQILGCRIATQPDIIRSIEQTKHFVRGSTLKDKVHRIEREEQYSTYYVQLSTYYESFPNRNIVDIVPSKEGWDTVIVKGETNDGKKEKLHFRSFWPSMNFRVHLSDDSISIVGMYIQRFQNGWVIVGSIDTNVKCEILQLPESVELPCILNVIALLFEFISNVQAIKVPSSSSHKYSQLEVFSIGGPSLSELLRNFFDLHKILKSSVVCFLFGITYEQAALATVSCPSSSDERIKAMALLKLLKEDHSNFIYCPPITFSPISFNQVLNTDYYNLTITPSINIWRSSDNLCLQIATHTHKLEQKTLDSYQLARDLDLFPRSSYKGAIQAKLKWLRKEEAPSKDVSISCAAVGKFVTELIMTPTDLMNCSPTIN